MKTNPTPPTTKALRDLGYSKTYAWQLVKGKRFPSLEVAQVIERATGYPASAWRKPDPAKPLSTLVGE